MGTEVEIRVSLRSASANAMLVSAQVVNCTRNPPGPRTRRPGLREESPCATPAGSSSRGSRVAQEFIEAEEDAGMANVICRNGARSTVDHAHPSTPPPRSPRHWTSSAGTRPASSSWPGRCPPGRRHAPEWPPDQLYKNNTETTPRAHENYLIAARRRSCRYAALVPFYRDHPVITGAGRVGIGQDGRTDGFQLSHGRLSRSKSAREHAQASLSTRDEAARHAALPRLHVIIGDAPTRSRPTSSQA